MASEITRETILQALDKVEHPEIAASLVELGMIQDISIDNNIVRVALALPTLGIPEIILNILVENIEKTIKSMDLQPEIEIFEMTDEVKNHFFALAQTRWKGSQ